MINGWDLASIAALITALVSIGVMVNNRRKDKADAAKQAADIYDSLCKTLRAEVEALRAETIRDRKRIEELSMQICDLEEALRISESERERLQREVDELSERLSLYEERPKRVSRKAIPDNEVIAKK